VALPGRADTIRGLGDNLVALISDESAYTDEEVWPAILPYMATNDSAALLCLSTPRGMNNFFAKQWHEGTDWKRFEIPASQCPRISAEYLLQMKETLGPAFEQEFNCSFLSEESAFFNEAQIRSRIVVGYGELQLCS
jgi:hypothetical protein